MRFLFLFLSFMVFSGYSQNGLKDSTVQTVLIGLNYKAALPAGDLGNRWGFHNHVGLDAAFKFKNNVTLSLNGGFLFGNQLRDTVQLSNIVNSYGTITDLQGAPADVLLLMRGFTAHASVGYVFNRFGNNPNSGLWVSAGLGYMGHKIRIESLYSDVPQLEGKYRMGYDKLTLGFSARQFIGYLYQADFRLLKFYGGFEFVEGITQNVRTYNFDLGGPDPSTYFDMSIGFKVGWIMPISQRTRGRYYFD